MPTCTQLDGMHGKGSRGSTSHSLKMLPDHIGRELSLYWKNAISFMSLAHYCHPVIYRRLSHRERESSQRTAVAMQFQQVQQTQTMVQRSKPQVCSKSENCVQSHQPKQVKKYSALAECKFPLKCLNLRFTGEQRGSKETHKEENHERARDPNSGRGNRNFHKAQDRGGSSKPSSPTSDGLVIRSVYGGSRTWFRCTQTLHGLVSCIFCTIPALVAEYS